MNRLQELNIDEMNIAAVASNSKFVPKHQKLASRDNSSSRTYKSEHHRDFVGLNDTLQCM